MADLNYLEQQADLLYNNIAGWEQKVLEKIGKRVGAIGGMSVSEVKSINNIAFIKQDMEQITKELTKMTGYNISQIEQMYADVLEQNHLASQPLYGYRGKKYIPFAENLELQAISSAYAKATAGTMINLSKTKLLGFSDSNGKFSQMADAYYDVLDKAVLQVHSGATDFHTAMRGSLTQLGGSGVRVDYGGLTRRLDTTVRQNLLWGSKQATDEYNSLIGKELGCDGIEVDYHSHSRPSHEFMQGKQYALGRARTINGTHYPSADEALSAMQEYGCRHYSMPIICGVSEPSYSKEQLEKLKKEDNKKHIVDGKELTGYEVTQFQRKIETEMRNIKSQKQVLQASNDSQGVKLYNERLKVYEGKYDEITKNTGIKKQLERTSIVRK